MACFWRTKVSLVAAVALAHVTFALECTASEEDEPIRLEYVAHADCPPEGDVIRRIRSYTTRWTRADPDKDARRFALRIERRGRTFAGGFDLTSRKSSGGSTIRREIEGDDCNHVATGLAVAVALAIDPGASLTPASGAAEAPAPESPVDAPPSFAPAPPNDSDEARAGSAPPPDVAPAPRRPAPRARREDGGAEPVAVSVGGRVELTGALSGALPVIGTFVEIGWPPSASLPWFAPALRLGAKQSLARTAELGAGEASVLWSSAFVELCPARLSLDDRVLISGCLTANAGVVSAEARDVPGAEAAHRAWFDYGGAAGVRWRVHAKIFVELVGGVAVPITRDRFRMTPDGAAMVPPRAGGSGGVGGGWRF